MSIKLGSICSFQSGGTPSKGKPEYFNGTIPWITTTALNGSLIDEENAVGFASLDGICRKPSRAWAKQFKKLSEETR